MSKNFGQSVTFECTATGLPTNTLSTVGFYNEGGDNVGGFEANTLDTLSREYTIDNIGSGDVGTYTCRAVLNIVSPDVFITDSVTLQGKQYNITLIKSSAYTTGNSCQSLIFLSTLLKGIEMFFIQGSMLLDYIWINVAVPCSSNVILSLLTNIMSVMIF